MNNIMMGFMIIEFLVGIGFILAGILLVYVMGLIPNLWSYKHISPYSISDILERGARILFYFMFAMILMAMIATIGHMFLNY